MLSHCIGLVFILVALASYLGSSQRVKLAEIPTSRGSGYFAFITDRFRFTFGALGMVQEGYDKFRGSIFRISALTRWVVIVTSPSLIEEMRKAPDDVFSFQEAMKDILQVEYTLGKPLHHDPYQVGTVRGPLTRNIGLKFSELRDEIVAAFQDLLPARAEWELITLNDILLPLVTRTSNRFFSGLPLCRDPDYIDLNIRFTIQVMLSAKFISIFPNIMKPLVGNLLTPVPGSVKRAKRHLAPIIEERLANEDRYGSEWPERPNDLLSWLLTEATSMSRRTINDLVMRFLTINFGAIHTTTMTVSAAMSCLALHPECIDELREEISSVVAQYGWSKAGMGQLRKLDSFLKESQRCYSYAAYASERKVLKDFTFSNGVTVPAGVSVAVPAWSIHHDDEIFPNAHKFDGFRFSRKRDGAGESFKHQMVTPNTEYFLFGIGRHACPGRFFAVNELKAIVSHILMTYDFKLEIEGTMPPVKWFGPGGMQDGKTRFWFRKRAEL